MELRHLRCFIAVAEEMNVTRAARRLYMAQPPLTRLIHDLEEELGVQLFERSKRRINLTPAGRTLQEHAYLIVAQCDEAIQQTQRIGQGQEGRLTIGFSSIAIQSVLPEIVRLYKTRFPAVELQLREQTFRIQAQELHSHQLDVAFAAATLQEEGIEQERVMQRGLIVALPATHPQALQTEVELSALAHENWIWFSRRTNPHDYDQNLQMCKQAGFSPKITQETDQLPALLSLVASELGIALLTGYAQNLQLAGVVYRPLAEPTWKANLHMLWREHEMSPPILAFLEAAREICAHTNLAV
jgi:DNA-binding transcriptional LysR family regulator